MKRLNLSKSLLFLVALFAVPAVAGATGRGEMPALTVSLVSSDAASALPPAQEFAVRPELAAPRDAQAVLGQPVVEANGPSRQRTTKFVPLLLTQRSGDSVRIAGYAYTGHF